MSDTRTATLLEFLTARLDEDEATARAALPGPWRYNPRKQWFLDRDKLRAAKAGVEQSGGEEFVGAGPVDATVGVAATGPADDRQSMADATHIARHDPARVLADVDAKRRIVALHTPTDLHPSVRIPVYCNWCDSCGMDEGLGEPDHPWPCDHLRLLALPFADHPDYDQAWRP